jgi:hypothetical protein
MLPMRSKPFAKMTKGHLTDILEYFTYKEGFSKFRKISKKFSSCFDQYLIKIITEAPQ